MSTPQTILIVDDEPDILDFLKFQLELQRFNVLSAQSAEEGLALIQAHQPQAVISDIRMPEMDGIRFLSRSREGHHEQPVFLFITGFADMTLIEALDQGAIALIEKPIDIPMMFKRLRYALKPKHERWGFSLDSKLTVETFEFQLECFQTGGTGQLVSFGLGGAFVPNQGDLHLSPGDQVRLTVRIAEGSLTLDAHGTVAWRRTQGNMVLPKGVGMEFFHLNSEAVAPFVQYLDQNRIVPFIPRS